MLTIDRMRDIRDGAPLRGFFVRNRQGKILATGADGAFVVMRAKRYANDLDLCRAVRKLTGLSPRGVNL